MGGKEQQEAARGIAEALPCVLFISGRRPVADKQQLDAAGITFIINAAAKDVPCYFPTEFCYHTIHVEDEGEEMLCEHFQTILDIVDRERRNGGRTLVHCQAGVSRSATLVLAYLMTAERWTLKDSFLYLKSRRPMVRPNNGFWQQLIGYEAKLYGKNSVHMVMGPKGLTPDICLKQVKASFRSDVAQE